MTHASMVSCAQPVAVILLAALALWGSKAMVKIAPRLTVARAGHVSKARHAQTLLRPRPALYAVIAHLARKVTALIAQISMVVAAARVFPTLSV